MKRFLLVMEQGGNFGHAAHISVLASLLLAEGHEVIVAGPLHELAARVFESAPYRLIETPLCQLPPLPRPVFSWASLATVYWDLGLCRVDLMPSLFEIWRSIYREVNPDVIVLNAAPFAQLAAIGLGVPRIQVGLPYGIPPPLSPLPSFRFWTHVPKRQALPFEAQLQVAITQALRVPNSYAGLGDLLDTDAAFISSMRELDPYPRLGGFYTGPLASPKSGLVIHWRSKGRKALVYLRARHTDVVLIARALQSLYDEIIVACPDVSDQALALFSGSSVRIFREYLDLNLLIPHSDLIVSHAGGLMLHGVAHGIAQVALPTQFEQLGSARLLAKKGLGIMAIPGDSQACTAAIQRAAQDFLMEARLTSARHCYAEYATKPGSRLVHELGHATIPVSTTLTSSWANLQS
jgi:UDP:flavonoid glycosyltransferase YjiC (YdhE family)